MRQPDDRDDAFRKLMDATRASLSPELLGMSVSEMILARDKPPMPPAVAEALRDLKRTNQS